MNVIIMFACGIAFGLGHSLAPYIIAAYKINKIKKAQRKLSKKMKKMKGDN